MVTQEFQQGKHKIKIESAESLEDAKKNNFAEGNYSRYYVNGKAIDNYMAMIKFITEEAKVNNSALISDEKDLLRTRNKMLETNNKEISAQLENLKKQYKEMGIPDNLLQDVNKMIDKINPMGIRVVE